MELVVLLSVLAITLTQVIARPADMEDDSKTKNLKEEIFKFLLPTALRHDLQITINGVFDLNFENFTVVLPIEGKEEHKHCTLNYNHKNQKLLVFPATKEEKREENYETNYDDVEKPYFVLSLRARENDNNNEKTLEMTLNGAGYGDSLAMACKMNSFEDFDHIRFKGVKNIDSILFQFQSTEVS